MTFSLAVFLGILTWFVIRCLLSGFYSVDQNERAVVTTFGKAPRFGENTTMDDPIAATLRPDEKERYSYPLFFDPGFDVEMDLIPNARIQPGDHSLRWDQRSVHEFKGTYGEYILSKVARVFPDLMRN